MPDKKIISENEFPRFLKQEYPNDPSWKAFFKLWLDAKGFFYGDQEQHIVDGAGDGGIDAIAFPPRGYSEHPIIVMQSKYYLKSVPDSALNSFLSAVQALKSDSKSKFESWIDKVKNKHLKTEYRDLWKFRKNIRFVIVTSGTISKRMRQSAKELGIEIEDKPSIKEIFFDMARGKSPRPERIKLNISSKVISIQKNEEHNMYVFSAKLASFAKVYQLEKKNLFAGNVRYALPGKTDVKKGIKETLDTKPNEFAYYHNGITIVCKKIIVQRNSVELISPSIVNGAQTVSYIGESLYGKIPKNASILVKALEVLTVGGFEEFETDVAMSSNTQNKVSSSDLSVTDPDLVKIERYFRTQKCFLERKKGDSPIGSTILRINKDRILQLFAALDKRTGPSSTKDKQALYRNHSGRLFHTYAKSVTKKRDALFIAMLDKLVRESLRGYKLSGTQGKKKSRRLSLSYYTIFRLTCDIIQDLKMWTPLRQAFSSDGIYDNQFYLKLDIDIRRVATKVLSYAKSDPDRNETAFFKNKDKVNRCIKELKSGLKRSFKFHKM